MSDPCGNCYDLPSQNQARACADPPRRLAENPNEVLTAELRALYTSFQRCLDLRDKYMTLSRQRLEDNPANYDGAFTAESSPTYASTSSLLSTNLPPSFKKWQIYPPPPEPHWKERDPHGDPPVETTDEIAAREAQRNRFVLSEVVIPGKEAEGKRRRFALDANGVYQVYSDGESPGEPASRDKVY